MILPLLLTLIVCSLVAGELCHVHPPYRGISIARLTYNSAASAASLRASLARACGLHRLNPADPANALSDVLLLAPAHRRLLAGDTRTRVEVLDVDLGASILREKKAIAPYPHQEFQLVSGGPVTRSGGSRPRADRGVDDAYYSRYHKYADLVDRWRTLSASRPNLRLEVYGTSTQGRPLQLLRVGRTSDFRPVRVVFTCLLHAREWVTTMAGLYVADALSAAAGRGGELSHLLKRVEVIVLPLVNPDGYVYTHTTDRIWRKNLQGEECRIGNFSRPGGIDLNRNWGVDFDGNQSTSNNSCSDIYTGKRAFSAMETAAVRDLVRRTPGIKGHIDVHSYSQLVLGPWLHTVKDPPNASVIDRVGKAMRHALSSGGEEYVYGRGRTNPLYFASGVSTDWFFGRGVLSYTFELRPSRANGNGFQGFSLATEQILPTCRETLAAMKVFIQNIAQLHDVSVKKDTQRHRLEKM